MLTNKPNSKALADTHDAIEKICQQGCTVVRQHIEVLIQYEKDARATSLPDDLALANKAQQKEILDELMAVMAVYDNKECDDS